MEENEELKARVERLESAVEALIGVVNKLVEDFYEPAFVVKLDKMASKMASA